MTHTMPLVCSQIMSKMAELACGVAAEDTPRSSQHNSLSLRQALAVVRGSSGAIYLADSGQEMVFSL